MRTPANGVRVRCATVTQILYTRNIIHYIHFFGKVKKFFEILRKRMSFRASSQAGVGISIKFAEC